MLGLINVVCQGIKKGDPLADSMLAAFVFYFLALGGGESFDRQTLICMEKDAFLAFRKPGRTPLKTVVIFFFLTNGRKPRKLGKRLRMGFLNASAR